MKKRFDPRTREHKESTIKILRWILSSWGDARLENHIHKMADSLEEELKEDGRQ